MRRARRQTLCIVAALAALSASCDRKTDPLTLPFAGPLASPGSAASASAGQKKLAAEDLDCDELPALTAEEEAMLSGEVPLERSRPASPPVISAPQHYTLLSDVALSEKVEERVGQIADAYFRRTGKTLVITSGTRDPAQQAKAMYKMLRLGADIVRLYRNKAAAREIKQAYDAGRAARKSAEQIVADMYELIRGQVAREVFISAHLRAGAVDVRNRGMSAAAKKALIACAAEVQGVYLLEETKPPHFHLQID